MIKNIVFDLGGVLIDWNPRYLYRKIFKAETEVERFVTEVCSQTWNERHDEGVTFAANAAALIAHHPHFEREIRAYRERWDEMIRGPIEPTVEILARLKREGRYRLLALTNWSAETFPLAEARFGFLKHFEGIVVSGRIGLKKPAPEIFHHLCSRFGVVPEESLFIDDHRPNIEAAARLGFDTEHFRSAAQLDERLNRMS